MPKRGYIGSGTLFQKQEPHVEFDDGDPDTHPVTGTTVFVTVATVKSGAPSGDNRENVDTTVIDSETDLEDSMAGLRATGEIAVLVHFRPEQDTFTDLYADYKAGTERHWRFLFDRLPNKPAMHFTGYISAWDGPSVAPRELLAVPMKIKVTAPTLAEAPELVPDTES